MGQYRALLVANSKFYADPAHLPELKAPIYDMARLYDALIHPELGVFDRERVRLLPNATCSDVLGTMNDFYKTADQQDTTLLYYSGHGVIDINNNFFLCAADTRFDRLMSTAIRDEQVNAMIKDSPARTFVLILDCCSSGAWKSPTELLPDALKGVGRFLLTSSRAGQNAGDAAVETESSAFTKLLVEALETAADTDKDGYVDIDEVYKHVDERLSLEGQQAQRNFGKSTRSVALARRPPGENGSRPPIVVPSHVGPNQPARLAVAPENIRISDIRRRELPLVERIYVFNRGGGALDWQAECDQEWISLESHDEFVKVTLAPISGEANRGSIYVRDRESGGVKKIPVLLGVRDEWPRRAFLALAAVVVAGALALVIPSILDEDPTPDPTLPSGVAVLARVEGLPTSINSFGPSVYVTTDADQLVQIDQKSGDQESITVGAEPIRTAFTDNGDSYVWVLSSGDNTVSRVPLPLSSGTAVPPIEIEPAQPSRLLAPPLTDAVWVAYSEGSALTRIDAGSGTPERIPVGEAPASLCYTPAQGSIWVANSGSDSISQVDADGTVLDAIEVGGGPSSIQPTEGHVWVANSHDGTVQELDADTKVVSATVDVGGSPTGVTIDNEGGVWVRNQGGATVSRIDVATAEVSPPVDVGATPGSMTVTPGYLWVATEDGLWRIDTVTEEALQFEVGGEPVTVRANKEQDLVFVALADGRILSVDPSMVE